ncbi:D-2-hydroxyacid dehydrogenase family protein [Rhodopila sp.]|uniref:D-2-hydroxyacid dehydrogenase family protein n=1 Tax=Rhodopila sp. TaxID=2480087 RepID=UPI003D0C43B9
MRIAILDDYQSVALTMADWSPLKERAEIAVFTDHVTDEAVLAERLAPFDILCVMRERTPLRRHLIEQLPNLKLIASTGPVNAALDVAAAEERGIAIMHTGYSSTPTIEMTWALILASQRHLVREVSSVRSGGWQRMVGGDLHGRTLGLLGLGNIGGAVARIGGAFGMRVIGRSKNLTPEKAAAVGAVAVPKEQLFADADVVSIHMLLSRRTRGLVDAGAIGLMRRNAWLINTSRGAIVDEAALLDALVQRRIAGLAVDVFDEEPLPADHPFRTMDNVLATPHLGYVSEGLYRTFYGDTVRNIVDWLDRGDP